MKIHDGKSMTAGEIRRAIDEAKEILDRLGVKVSASDLRWLEVRDWLITRRTKRSARQAALCYLDIVKDDLMII